MLDDFCVDIRVFHNVCGVQPDAELKFFINFASKRGGGVTIF